MLPLICDPKGQSEALINSEMPENFPFFFEDRHSKRLSFTLEVDLQYRTPEI